MVTEIDRELRAAGSPDWAAHQQAYLKSDLVHFGASVPAIRSVAKRVAEQHPDLTHDDLIKMVTDLWSELDHERRMVTVELLALYSERLGPDDFDLIECLLRESRTWALVDGLAASVVGRLVERYGEIGPVLPRWAADDDFWLRRSALLALLAALRRGQGDFDRFSRYADTMLDDRGIFIRKAIGWVLRYGAQAPGPRLRVVAPPCRPRVVSDHPRGHQAVVRRATHGDPRGPVMSPGS